MRVSRKYQLLVGTVLGFLLVSIVFLGESNGNDSKPTVPKSLSLQLTRLTDNPAYDFAPCWSPSGDKVAFCSKRDYAPAMWVNQIYTMNSDGSNEANLTNLLSHWAYYPDWSPDGRLIVYDLLKSDLTDEVWIMNSDGSSKRKLAESVVTSDPQWSPDCTKIAFVKSWADDEVWVMDSSGGNQECLTCGMSGWAAGPDWSPNGTEIVFFAFSEGSKDIYVMNSDGTNIRRLTYCKRWEAAVSPRWSPDGNLIAFNITRTDSISYTATSDDIYLMNNDGSDTLKLFPDMEWTSGTAWSPDSHTIAFVWRGEQGDNMDIYSADLGLGCCDGRVGDANGAGGDEPTIGDISTMIDAKFITGSCEGIIECLTEADINQSGGIIPTCDDITIGDISMLIDYLFITGSSLGLPECL